MKKVVNFFHYLFAPKEENNYKAKILQTDFLSFYLVFALFLTFFVKASGGNLKNVLGFATDITIQKLLQLTNEERSKNNLNTLKYNEKLSLAAEKKAQDMFEKNYWAHYAPDGKTPWDFILQADYQYEYAGENLAKNFLFSQGVVDAWMDSKTHRENVLRKEYTEVGFAVVNGILNGEETTLIVQTFAKPLNSKTVTDKSPTENQSSAKNTASKEKTVNNEAPVVLSKKTFQSKFSLNNLPLSMYVGFFIFLIAALVIDFYFAYRLNLIRITGKNLIHVGFIGFVIIGLYFLTKGTIV